jgi:hypothetical protein
LRKAIGALRVSLGAMGIALLGVALAYAPIAAFDGDMAIVTKLGLAGVALVLLAWLLRGFDGRRESDETQRNQR